MAEVTLTDRVRALFVSRPGEWIDGRELAQVGGYAGWRSRVVNCRERGMTIVNHQQRRPGLTISRYKYLPPVPRTPEDCARLPCTVKRETNVRRRREHVGRVA